MEGEYLNNIFPLPKISASAFPTNNLFEVEGENVFENLCMIVS